MTWRSLPQRRHDGLSRWSKLKQQALSMRAIHPAAELSMHGLKVVQAEGIKV